MSAENGGLPTDRRVPGNPGHPDDTGAPKDWKAALAALVSARLEIIRIEAKPASSAAAVRVALFSVGLFGLFTAWVLALVASIGSIAAATSWQWYHVAFAAAGVHLLIGLLILPALKSRKRVSFPVTRAEFEKDREWLNRLKDQ